MENLSWFSLGEVICDVDFIGSSLLDICDIDGTKQPGSTNKTHSTRICIEVFKETNSQNTGSILGYAMRIYKYFRRRRN